MRLLAKYQPFWGPLFVLLALICPVRGAGDGFTIVSVKLKQSDRTLVYVRFEGPGPKPEDVKIANNWQVQVVDGSGWQVFPVTQADTFEPYVNTHIAKLTVSKAIPESFASLNVTYKPMNTAQGSATPRSSSGTTIAPADGKEDSNLYLKGSVARTGIAYTYSVDSSASLRLRSFGKNDLNAFELTGTINADSDELGDPDSIDLHLRLRTGVSHPGTIKKWLGFDYRGYAASLDMPSLQTDKETNVLDLIATPTISAPLTRVFWKPNGGVPIGTLSIVPMLGSEAGWNVRNDLILTGGSSRATGGILRGLAGATVTFSWADSPIANRVLFTSTYTARVLARDEIFQETRGVSAPVPYLKGGTRHYIEDSIEFMINKYAGLSFTHEYGSVPPAYKFVDQRLTIGVVFALKQDAGH